MQYTRSPDAVVPISSPQVWKWKGKMQNSKSLDVLLSRAGLTALETTKNHVAFALFNKGKAKKVKQKKNAGVKHAELFREHLVFLWLWQWRY